MRSRSAPKLRRLTCLLLGLAALCAALAPAFAQARTTRPYQSSFGSFATRTPGAVAVDQANGDVYAVDQSASEVKIYRFNAAGAPKNFTAGPDAGTNTLTIPSNPSARPASIAIDNSGGPLNGTIYISDGAAKVVRVFAASGAELGQLTGTGVEGGGFFSVFGAAVDQANGDLYVSGTVTNQDFTNHRVWRYSPASPVGGIEDTDYTLVGAINVDSPASMAADGGKLYVVHNASGGGTGPVERYAAADFSPGVSQAIGTVVDSAGVSAVAVDHTTGEVYANEGKSIAVFDANDTFSYRFGAIGLFGFKSAGIAVKSAASGPASFAYVGDPSSQHQIDVFGAPSKALTYTHPQIASFGPDGTAATRFSLLSPEEFAFRSANRGLYMLDYGVPGVFGFDVSAGPAFAGLSGFTPLGTAALEISGTGARSSLAVDDSGGASAGNVYVASGATNLIYGFDETGAGLGGFPVDPATAPGAPDGSPTRLCGAAVDSTGKVWIANLASKKILTYSAAGAYLGSVDTTAQAGGPCHLAFNSADDLYADINSSGVWKYSAASGYTAATQVVGGDPGFSAQTHSMAVDPADDHLYVVEWSPKSWVDEFDPAGNLVEEFATDLGGSFGAIAVDSANDYLYIGDSNNGQRVVRVLGPGVLLPEPSFKPASALANATATINGEVVTQGLALSDCHFEYVSGVAFANSGFSDLSSGDSVPCTPGAGSIPLDLDAHPVSADISGLETNTAYRYRLVATNANGSAQSEAGALSTTGPPQVESTGAPIRSTDTAQLTARVYPVRAATDYHFEWGTDTSYGHSTTTRSAGEGDQFKMIAEEIDGLAPNTTYHYRIVADNGNPDGAAVGADMTVKTRAFDEPLSHGNYPGPPGSDRAYEQVSLADASGNPVSIVPALSTDGNRALYGIAGGTPIASTGSFLSLYFAQRDPEPHPTRGWQTKLITPPRDELVGPSWNDIAATEDLSSVAARNAETVLGSGGSVMWRLHADGVPEKLFFSRRAAGVRHQRDGHRRGHLHRGGDVERRRA